MPRIELVSSNKEVRGDNYPRLKLDTGEKALIVCIEPVPEVEFVHTLRAPVISPDGTVQTETKKNKKGEEYQATVTDFVGLHLCFGNYDTLTDKGVDVNNCPTCKASVEGQGIDAPNRRYAMHVLRYSLDPQGKLSTPFAVSVQAWVFANAKFDALVDLAEEWGNLQEHDLLLTCKSKMYQNFDIAVRQKAAWQANKETAALASETYKHNKAASLTDLIGRRISKDQARDDIEKVQEQVARAQGRVINSPVSEREASLDADVASLLGEPVAPAQVAPAKSLEDQVAIEVDNRATEEVAQVAPWETPSTEEAAIPGWDDLFANLD